MAPAAVDCRSPITSSQRSQSTQPSPFQNPNPTSQGPSTFGSFGSDNRSQQDSNTVESLNIDKASDATFNWSFSSPFTSQMNFEKSIPSSASGRSRPRLFKVRKQSSSHYGRSNSVSVENNSVHNFFPSTPENLSRANDSTAKPNGFSGSVTEGNKFANLQNSGLQFGTNKGASVLNSNVGQSDAGELGKFDNLGFVFGANNSLPNEEKNGCKLKKSAVNKSDMVFDSNSDKSGGASGINELRKFDDLGFESQKFGNMAFSLDSNLAKSEPTSSSKRAGETGENVEIYNEREEENKTEFRKVDNGDFVFGASKNIGKLVPDIGGEMKFDYGTSSSGTRSNSKLRHLTNAYLKSKQCGRNAGKSDFADKGRKNENVETKFQKDKVNGVFIFGSGSKESSTFDASSKKSDGMNKLKSERAENCNGFMKSQNPLFNVSEKMQSLNIGDSEKVGCRNSNSCANFDNHMFVFGSTKKNFDPSTGISGISSSDQLKRGDLSNAFEKMDEADAKADLKRVFEFGNIEKNQPVNLTEESLTGTQYTGNQLNSDTQCNKASFPSSSSSMGFSFQASEAPPVDKVEKEKFNFTGFSTPSLNTPYSFANNLSFYLSKTLEFNANSSRSVRERKLKKTRGKLRQHNKVHVSKEDGNSQQNHQKSPECFSPMDFSPCQAASTVPTKSKGEENDHNWAGIASEEAEGGFCENKQEEETGGRKQFSFATTSGNSGNTEERESSFSLSSAQENSSTTKRYKKYRMKTGDGAKFTTPSGKGGFASLPLDAEQGKNVKRRDSERKGDAFAKADEEQVKMDPSGCPTLEACQSWRNRGNKAYRNGDLSMAEDFYTKGINVIPHTNLLGCFIEALVLCYSNRATTRLALGRMREALEDCRMASSLDPNFLKVHIRAANCHLVLGEVEDAIQYFSKCLESGNEVCLDRRITIEAADGVQKAKKVIDCTNGSAELLKQKTSDAASNALGIINEALSISCYSESLLEMKGEALCMLRKHEKAVQMCERTLDFAEKNFAAVDCGPKSSSVRLWRWRLMSKSYFYLGKLDVALDFIEKQEQLQSINDKNQESSVTLAFTIRELLLRKNAGNEAFQIGKHTEAIEHYTAAISSSVESRPFAAVCFCNRAAAHQAFGQITDAIADCSLSIALDGNYTKALSRRATLHEMIRDYEQAANDLQKLVSVLENQSQEKSQKSGGSVKDLRKIRHRLSSMEEKARKGTPLDLYMILGVKASDPASEIKKAYRKAALRHHPDKAGQFLARCEIGDDVGLYKEIAEKIHTDADRLFKMIGEAYAVLSDTGKRSKYDLQEEMRDDEDEDEYRSSSFGRASNFNSSPFESSSNNRRYWRESWKTYGNSSSRW